MGVWSLLSLLGALAAVRWRGALGAARADASELSRSFVEVGAITFDTGLSGTARSTPVRS
jgi:hypothetical protein